MTAGDAMNATPRTISPDEFAARALSIMEDKKITSLVVVDPAGALWRAFSIFMIYGDLSSFKRRSTICGRSR